MEYFTAPGQGYVILTAGGTITSPDGTFSLTLDAGQTYFRATTDKIIVSDASATLCPVAKWPGMQPISVNILGEGTVSGDVPASYIVCSFLESTGDQIIDTGLTLDSTSVIRSTSRTPATTAGQWEALYDTDYYMGAYYVNAQFCFIIYDENVNNICYSTYTTDTVYTIEQAYDSITINGEKLAYSDLGSGVVYDPTKPLCLFNRAGGSNPGKVRLMSLSVTTGGNKVGDYVPVLNEAGVPCMYDKVTRRPYLNTGDTQFIAGMSTAQALNLAKLPAGGGELTISLPDTIVSAAGDVLNEEVAAAIETATDNGWTITVQSYIADDLSDVGGDDYIRANFIQNTGTQLFLLDHNDEKVIGWRIKGIMLEQPAGYAACFSNWDTEQQTCTRLIPQANTPAPLCYKRYIASTGGTHLSQCSLKELFNIEFINTDILYNGVRYTARGPETSSNLAPIGIFQRNGAAHTFSLNIFRVYSFSLDEPEGTVCDLIPCIRPDGEIIFLDKVTKKAYTRTGDPAIVGLTASQALNLANLPAKTASLTISLPASIVSGSTITDTQVASAIETAKSKGWTITVRTYTE